MAKNKVSPHKNKRPTLSMIAERLGVSISLVSKVLSGRMGTSSVRIDLADRIRATASEIGFVPNITAQAFVRGCQDAIAVLFCRHGQPGSGIIEDMLDASATELLKYQKRMVFQFFETEEDLRRLLRTVAHPNVVDGVFLAGSSQFDPYPAIKEAMQRTPIPFATMLKEALAPNIPNVGLRQADIGKLAATHFLECGVRSPLFLKTGESFTSVGRLKGFCETYAAAGYPIPEQNIINASYDITLLPEIMQYQIRDRRGLWDGIQIGTDRQAGVIYRELLHYGLSIPDDVQIIGIDDSPYCDVLYPTLTSISGVVMERTKRALFNLNELMEGRPLAEYTSYIQPKLIVRQSTRPKPMRNS